MRAAKFVSILPLVLSIASLGACELDSSDELEYRSMAAELCDSSTEWDSKTTPPACEMDIPVPPEGETFDPTKVNITIEVDEMPTNLPHVEGEGDCNSGGGWYYSPNNLEPKKIVLCPSTCAWVQTTEKLEIKVLLGCQTITDAP